MHPGNRYNQKPDFAHLASLHPRLEPFVTISTEDQYASIDFKDPDALRVLTEVLLKEDWGYEVEIVKGRLVPTLASRLEYLLHVLDLEPYLDLARDSLSPKLGLDVVNGEGEGVGGGLGLGDDVEEAKGSRGTRVLDIGTGAIAIYPLLLHRLRPNAAIFATEIDVISFNHAQAVLEKNNIPSSQIELSKASANDPILFPLSSGGEKVDVMLCNPPFFASEEEMREGMEMKAGSAHAAPTAAENELITPGGEVAFVGHMITESIELKDQCQWFTSLIGKYSSLSLLVQLLHTHKIDNYFIKSIRPAKTTRWILAWSHTPIRLPDHLTRPPILYPNTSFTRLLPPPNKFTHTPLHPPLFVEQLKQAINGILAGINISLIDGVLEPKEDTWSRAARRAAARKKIEPDETGSVEQDLEQGEPIFRASLSFVSPSLLSDSSTQSDEEWQGATLALEWQWGKDRDVVEAFWKFLLSKAGLIGGQGSATGSERARGGRGRVGRGGASSGGNGTTRGQGRGRAGFARE